MLPRHSRSFILGIGLVLWVCIARADVVPLSGMLSVRGGQDFTIALRSGGTVWAWGDNSGGQLGDGTNDGKLFPTQVLCGEAAGDPDHCSQEGHLKNAVSVAAGSLASMALLDNGSVLIWGINSRFNNPTQSNTPVYVVCGAADAAHCAGGRITGATQISVGFSHAMVLLDDGAVLAWGTNNNGNLGNSQSGIPSPLPVQVSGLSAGSGVVAIAAGFNYSFSLKANGTVMAWGANNGALGNDSTAASPVPVSVVCRQGDAPGSTFCSAANVLQGAIAVSTGNGTALALMNDHTVLAWGPNTFGQVGDGTTTQRRRPVNVCATGATMPCQPASGNILQNVTSLAGSSLTSAGYALLFDGSLLSWGNNSNGQLGDGTTTPRTIPGPVSGFGAGSGIGAISAGDVHAVATLSDGFARSWGNNASGQLGNGSISANPSPVPAAGLGAGSGVIALASRGQFTLALKADGKVLAWGNNSNGQLGIGTLLNSNIPIPVLCRAGDAPGSAFCSSDGHLQGVVSIATGNLHAMALLANGSVVTWGLNANGQLGDGTNTQRTLPVSVCAVGAAIPCAPTNGNILIGVTAVSASGQTSLARTSIGGVVSWGNNANGFLGIGNALPAATSIPLNVVCRAGDALGSTFCSPSGLLQGVLSLASAVNAEFAIMNNGTVLAWGLNLTNQLGDGTAQNRNRPVNVCAVGATQPCTVASGNVLQGIVAVAGAGNTGFALTSTGALLAWGANTAATVGDGSTIGRPAPVSVCAVGATPPCLAANGNVLQGVSKIAAGVNSGYAVLTNGTVVGWGANSSGQLGDGTFLNRPTPVVAAGLSGVASLSAGTSAVAALLVDGSVVTWGANGVGELGDGTSYTETLVPGPIVFDDTTPPTLTFGTPIPASPNGQNGWYLGNVSIPWTAADAHSTVSNQNIPANPLIVTGEGSAVTGSVTICDIAQNCATFWSPSVKIDRTAPQAAASATPNQLWPPDRRQADVAIRITANDNLELPSQPVSALTVSSNEPGSTPILVQPAAFSFDQGSTTSGSSITVIRLVAEIGRRGETRTYTVSGAVQDAAGHSAPFSVVVTVARPK